MEKPRTGPTCPTTSLLYWPVGYGEEFPHWRRLGTWSSHTTIRTLDVFDGCFRRQVLEASCGSLKGVQCLPFSNREMMTVVIFQKSPLPPATPSVTNNPVSAAGSESPTQGPPPSNTSLSATPATSPTG